MLLMLIISSIILTLSSAIILSINPLTMGIVILSISLILTLTYSLILTSWIAFLIFLIYVGGILVIFTYFVALTPNQQTSIIIVPLLLIFIASLILTRFTKNLPVSPSTNKFIYTFYQVNNIQLLLVLALILLFTIVVVVKLVINNKGPLRPFIN